MAHIAGCAYVHSVGVSKCSTGPDVAWKVYIMRTPEVRWQPLHFQENFSLPHPSPCTSLQPVTQWDNQWTCVQWTRKRAPREIINDISMNLITQMPLLYLNYWIQMQPWPQVPSTQLWLNNWSDSLPHQLYPLLPWLALLWITANNRPT